MPNRCKRLGALGLFVWLLACVDPSRGQNSARPKKPMQPSTSSSVSLNASQQDGSRPLASEEGADFSLSLENGSASPVTVRSIDNVSTARYTLFDSAGRTLGPYDATERRERVVGHTGTQAIPPPAEVSLRPGEKEEQWVGMWAFRDPLPPGKYSFSASRMK